MRTGFSILEILHRGSCTRCHENISKEDSGGQGASKQANVVLILTAGSPLVTAFSVHFRSSDNVMTVVKNSRPRVSAVLI